MSLHFYLYFAISIFLLFHFRPYLAFLLFPLVPYQILIRVSFLCTLFNIYAWLCPPPENYFFPRMLFVRAGKISLLSQLLAIFFSFKGCGIKQCCCSIDKVNFRYWVISISLLCTLSRSALKIIPPVTKSRTKNWEKILLWDRGRGGGEGRKFR